VDSAVARAGLAALVGSAGVEDPDFVERAAALPASVALSSEIE
jgi:hypothetical protein